MNGILRGPGLALALGLAGMGQALAQASDVVCDECIDNSDLGFKSVTGDKIGNNAVSTSRLRDEAVTTPKLAPNAVTGSRIASQAVGSSKLANGAVTAAKLGLANTVFIDDSGNDATNCLNLAAALAGLADNAADNPYVILLGPATFECGDSSVVMKPFVDIQGSGQTATRIRGPRSSNNVGVVELASDVELRFLTVENTRGSGDGLALNAADATNVRITNVTALAPSNDAFNDALFVTGASSVTVLNSVFLSEDGLFMAALSTVNVVASLVSASQGAGLYRCVAAYDQNHAELNASCD